ncbi:hypothetical protein [Leptospira ilyithenensis]|uniref:Uncharacterized protein n=1 Tax=Leptospira ilyithenensis TaxID=2484901 RepID=A0A4R9LLP7_9LEPT|nr:hypothetical protein [Leptospira ilyithenensis]TGN06908.1 hypothetical protein EHS11_17370 [Leptospira ilyithenensis]
MIFNYKFFFLIIFFFSRCSVYSLEEKRNLKQNNTAIDKEISYELIGWETNENREMASLLLKTLHTSGKFKKISSYVKSDSETRVQIILESSPRFKILFGESAEPVSWMVERKLGSFSLYILNRVAAMQSFLIIPIFLKNDDTILFRVWNKNRLVGEHIYPAHSLYVVGWVSLLLRWSDDRETLDKHYSDIVHQFIEDTREVY